MGLFNLGGSEQKTTQTTTNTIDTRATTGGDIVTTDSAGAEIQNISGQQVEITNISPDPSIGILQSAVDTVAGFADRALQGGADAQTRALQFASGVDIQAGNDARMSKTTKNLIIAAISITAVIVLIRVLK